ncbi:ornithine cyclodeaminase family protein [Sandaracinus amylolyticus]|uniref:ornithine cyclodeaminase family protein n=1 Tax=Sandaracinus amylolyticus TaxID=927083 RepID=UPI00069F793A|nr:alanine dehydrogenase [Sandaracinus amylolyticus]
MKSRRTLVLTRREVESVATMPMAVSAVEEAFAAHGRGEARMPPKVYLDLPEHDGDFRAMPSALAHVAGVKWVNSHPQNPARHGLPSVMGVYVLSDPETALPLAILDATWLTALRTGAAAAVASKHLASGAPRTVGFVGSGVQARTMLAAHRVVFGESFEPLFSDRVPALAEGLARELGGRAVSVEEACRADVVNTSTPSRTPVVKRAWLAASAHVNAMGADGPGKQELDPDILDAAQVVIDEPHQAEHSGEINVAIHDGRYALSKVAGTLGEVIVGAATIDRGALTVFDSTGLAIQDVALAWRIVEAARAKSVGVELDLVGVG